MKSVAFLFVLVLALSIPFVGVAQTVATFDSVMMVERGKFVGYVKGIPIAFEVCTDVSFEVVSGQIKLVVPAVLPMISVKVFVNLDRNGAQMFLDGERVGDAPDEILTTPGVHHLKLVYVRYGDTYVYEDSVFVKLGREILVHSDKFRLLGK
ncbi:MAG: hypothetical protein WC659_02320 [Patescibacteria group bacterium]